MFKAVIIGTIALVLFIILIAWSVEATTYCMKVGGNNSYSGVFGYGADNLDSAWATLNHAMSDSCGAGAGDTVLINVGTYTGSHLENADSFNLGMYVEAYGSATDPLVYKGYQGRPIFDCGDTITVDPATSFYNHVMRFTSGYVPNDSFFVIVESLIVRNLGSFDLTNEVAGFYVRRAHQVDFRYCVSCTIRTEAPTGNLASGFGFAQTSACTAYVCSSWYVYEEQCDENQACFNFYTGGGSVGRENALIKCYGREANQGVQLKSFDASTHLLVDSCVFHDCLEGIRICADSCIVRYNRVYDCSEPMVHFGGYGDIYGGIIHNNTFVQFGPDSCGWTRPSWCSSQDCAGRCIGLDGTGDNTTESTYVFNNIIIKDNGVEGGNYNVEMQFLYNEASRPDTLYSNYNCFWDTTGGANVRISDTSSVQHTFSQWQSTYNRDLNSIVSDPYFVDLANRNFALSDSSPCRTTGRGGDWPSYMGALDPEAGETAVHRKRLGAGVWGKGQF